MDWLEIINNFSNSIIIPVITLLGVYLVKILNKFLDNITNSILEKNEINTLESAMKTEKAAMDLIDSVSKNAVASLNQFADQSRDANGKLSSAIANQLATVAQQKIKDALGDSIITNGGKVLELVGGEVKLNNIISDAIEKNVYEYKETKKKTAVG